MQILHLYIRSSGQIYDLAPATSIWKSDFQCCHDAAGAPCLSFVPSN